MSRVTAQFRKLFRQNPSYRIPMAHVRNSKPFKGNDTEFVTVPMDPDKRGRLSAV